MSRTSSANRRAKRVTLNADIKTLGDVRVLHRCAGAGMRPCGKAISIRMDLLTESKIAEALKPSNWRILSARISGQRTITMNCQDCVYALVEHRIKSMKSPAELNDLIIGLSLSPSDDVLDKWLDLLDKNEDIIAKPIRLNKEEVNAD